MKDFLKNQLEFTYRLQGYAETKNGLLATASLAVLVSCAGLDSSQITPLLNHSITIIFITFSISALLNIIAMIPNVNSGEPAHEHDFNCLFFMDICIVSPDTYLDHTNSMIKDVNKQFRMYAAQIVQNSKIVKRKLYLFNISCKIISLGISLGIISILFGIWRSHG